MTTQYSPSKRELQEQVKRANLVIAILVERLGSDVEIDVGTLLGAQEITITQSTSYAHGMAMRIRTSRPTESNSNETGEEFDASLESALIRHLEQCRDAMKPGEFMPLVQLRTMTTIPQLRRLESNQGGFLMNDLAKHVFRTEGTGVEGLVAVEFPTRGVRRTH